MKEKIRHLFIFPAAVLFCAPLSPAQEEPGNDGTDEVVDISTVEDTDDLPPARKAGEVPAMFRDDAMLDESISNQELGINVYTAPSISKIFNQLDNLPPIPEEYVLRKRPEKLPTAPGKLALEMGYLLADGFIAVRSGHMNDVKPIALDLSRYGKAMGVGEKMNAHAAGLLEYAEKGQLEEFKRVLTNTQSDVNDELASLKDPDLAHLIALGGWIRALDAALAAIETKFDADQAKVLFYPDAPEYFLETLQWLNPQTAKKLHTKEMGALLEQLAKAMYVEEGAAPSEQKISELHGIVKKLSTHAVGSGNEH